MQASELKPGEFVPAYSLTFEFCINDNTTPRCVQRAVFNMYNNFGMLENAIDAAVKAAGLKVNTKWRDLDREGVFITSESNYLSESLRYSASYTSKTPLYFTNQSDLNLFLLMFEPVNGDNYHYSPVIKELSK
jgi:hypothetical protein